MDKKRSMKLNHSQNKNIHLRQFTFFSESKSFQGVEIGAFFGIHKTNFLVLVWLRLEVMLFETFFYAV
jgi:hypothetical protein